MATATTDMEIDERDYAVLAVLLGGRSNPYHIRDETGLGKGGTNTVLNRLGRAGYVRQTTRGLYEITPRGAKEVLERDEMCEYCGTAIEDLYQRCPARDLALCTPIDIAWEFRGHIGNGDHDG
jgi:predicted transcriptional regulator